MKAEDSRGRISEFSSVSEYLQRSLRTIDGLACLGIAFVSLAGVADLLVGPHVLPLRFANDPSKATVLLVASPLLAFLLVVWLRQFPFATHRVAAGVRAVLCVVAFVSLNS